MPSYQEFRKIWQAVGPLVRSAVGRGQIFTPQCHLTEPLPDIMVEYDVVIPLSNGTHVTANVFRSRAAVAAAEPMPVVMCAHPYDNHLIPALGKTPFGGPPQQYRLIRQGGKPEFSAQTSWESPDPNFWVGAGYAVVNMNMPGYANSGGKPSLFSPQQAEAFSEAIEWVGAQSWCSGGVGLTGVSYLAISQFAVAASQTPHGVPSCLRAICPWEGITSFYNDLFFEGGIEERGFPTFWWYTEVKPTINCSEAEFVEIEGQLPHQMAQAHPYYDEYWKAKEPDLASIELPMLVCASFSDQGLHTRGSFRAFMQARSQHKWVYTHRWLKWDAYYSLEVSNLAKRFFDRFVKGEDNGFDAIAPVRLEVRRSRDQIHDVRDEFEWPLARTEYQQLFLCSSHALVEQSVNGTACHRYDAVEGSLRFRYVFEEDTELTGYMKLRLWVEAQGADDMALFIGVDKLDENGVPVRFYGSVGNYEDLVSRGLLKVSRRRLDDAQSTTWQPVLQNVDSQLLSTGEIVPVDIALQPSSTFFNAGEGIELVIAPRVVVVSPPYVKANECNQGTHVVHVGGDYDSHLLIPKIPANVSGGA